MQGIARIIIATSTRLDSLVIHEEWSIKSAAWLTLPQSRHLLVFNFSWRHKVVPSYWRIVEADAEKLGQRINVAVDALAFVVRVDLVSVETRTEELTRKSRWRVVLARLSLYPRISGRLSSEIRIHSHLPACSPYHSSRRRRMCSKSYRKGRDRTKYWVSI